jgi:hypothetical protein
VRFLDGLRQDAHVLDLVARAGERQAVFSPGAADDLEALVEALARALHRDAEAAELGRLVAAAQAELEPPARDDVDLGPFLGNPQRMLEWRDDHGRADAHPARCGGDGPGERGERGADAVRREVVLRQPHDVEAELVGQTALLERVPVHLGVRLPLTNRQEVLGREFHSQRLWANRPRSQPRRLTCEVNRDG